MTDGWRQRGNAVIYVVDRDRVMGAITVADEIRPESRKPSKRSISAASERANLRLLLSGPRSSAGRPMPDGATPGPGGWNRIHLIVDDIDIEVGRLRDADASFRNDVVEGPGGKQILLQDPSGNVVELFQPAGR